MTSTDVIVIGGGPIGLVTAIHARRRGLSVRLLDRRVPPIDKACGEGLMPDGVAALSRLGLDLEASGRPFHGIHYLDAETEAVGRFPQAHGLGIRRTDLHARLVRCAESEGVDLHWGVTARGIESRGVETTAGLVAGDWIVAADGVHSRARNWLKIGTRSDGDRYAVRRHFAVEPWTDLVEVHWGDRCEAYVTPVGDRLVGVAFLWSGDKSRFDALLARFPVLQARLAGASVASRDLGAGALCARPAGVVSGRAALVGDAAGYLDPITGEGLSLGLLQADALAQAISGGRLGPYERKVRQLSRLPFALIRTLLFVERRPDLRHRLIRTLGRDPDLFSRLLAIHARNLRPSELGIDGLARLARGLAASH